MAKPKKSASTGTRPRHDTPIGVKGTVDELPPRQYSTQATEILNQIVAAEGKYVELDPAGRQPNSVQSMISSAAERQKINVSVAIRGDRVFARVESEAS